MTKFCKDCKFCVPERGFRWGKDFRYAKCSAHDEERKDADENFLVTGKRSTPPRYYCSIERAHGPCDPEGKLWQARQ